MNEADRAVPCQCRGDVQYQRVILCLVLLIVYQKAETNNKTVEYIRGHSIQEGIKRCGIIASEEEVGKIGNNKVLCFPFVSSNCPFPVIQIERGHFKLNCNKYKSVAWKNCLT